MANPGSPLITIVDISRVVARIDVPQAEASTVKVGQTAILTRPDSKDEIEGKVTVVSPAADPNTTTVQIWIQVDNPGERLKPERPSMPPSRPKYTRQPQWFPPPRSYRVRKAAPPS